MEEKYNSWNLENIKEMYELAKELHEIKDKDPYEIFMMIPDKYADSYEAVTILDAFEKAITYNINLSLEVKDFYRIGEPHMGMYGSYKPSYNYADNCPELGISVITTKWLDSLKSVFFGAHDDKTIAAKGVYKIKGVQIATGGDDEPLIYAMDWAEKTEIKTLEELRNILQKGE